MNNPQVLASCFSSVILIYFCLVSEPGSLDVLCLGGGRPLWLEPCGTMWHNVAQCDRTTTFCRKLSEGTPYLVQEGRHHESHFSPSLKFCHLWQEKAFVAKCNMERHDEKPSEAFTSEIHYTVEIWNLVKSGHDVTTNEKYFTLYNTSESCVTTSCISTSTLVV